jgi:hypothetical protein
VPVVLQNLPFSGLANWQKPRRRLFVGKPRFSAGGLRQPSPMPTQRQHLTPHGTARMASLGEDQSPPRNVDA